MSGFRQSYGSGDVGARKKLIGLGRKPRRDPDYKPFFKTLKELQTM